MLTGIKLLQHKLNDGKYRALQMGCYAERVTTADVPNLVATDVCYYCHRTLHDDYDLEHLTPLKRRGSHVASNLAKACRNCNQTKGDMLESTFVLINT